jgi:spore coat protein U-like protein
LPIVFGAASARAQSCSVVRLDELHFPPYDVTAGAPDDTLAGLTYRCDGAVAVPVAIDLGRGAASSYFPRAMRNGPASLEYNLYLDATRTVPWGDGTGGSSRYGPVLALPGVEVTVNLYARIPARQLALAGFYADMITVTLNF